MILKLLMVISGVAMYSCGELYNKNLKFLMGVPIGILGAALTGSLIPLWCILTYFLATEIGYGENNWLTKLVGKDMALAIHACALGVASFPIIGWWCLLQMLVSDLSFYAIVKLDNSDKMKEPWVGILRGLSGTCLLWL